MLTRVYSLKSFQEQGAANISINSDLVGLASIADSYTTNVPVVFCFFTKPVNPQNVVTGVFFERWRLVTLLQ